MIQLFNTLTGEKETFKPRSEGKVSMYVCGVTVYDLCHIGHARSAVVFDIIRRYFLYRGFDVTFVKNFTDIDDKIIKRSNETGELWTGLTARYIAAHDEDMGRLGVLNPTHTPYATHFIEGMIDFCKVLMEKGFAYESEGDVYYRVNNFEGYGKLSGKNLDDLLAGARVEVNERKENPLDFVLWKSAKPGEPSWESPWGPGRPGWHIECSVMSNQILGVPFDIHGGGKDLVFPHHENEIAQSEAHAGCTLANYWMHNGFVNINQEKMSKSLGNFFTIRDILGEYDPEILRFFLLTSHYRQPLDYSNDKLVEAESALERIYTYLDELSHATAGGTKAKNLVADVSTMLATFFKDFESAMDDDFNTPMALAALFEAVRAGNAIIAARPDAETLEMLLQATHEITDTIAKTLGVITKTSAEWFKMNLMVTEDEVKQAIVSRNDARKNKDFQLADSIREELRQKGVEIIDTVNGTRYRTKRIRA